MVKDGMVKVIENDKPKALSDVPLVYTVPVDVMALNGNAAVLYLGGRTVRQADKRGYELDDKDTVTVPANVDFSTIYIDGTAGDGVTWVAFEP